MSILVDLADIEVQLSGGGCERIQMQAVVASFYAGVRKSQVKVKREVSSPKKRKGF